RHLVDSLAILGLLPKNASVLDVGTGAGFPAWPVAWARPDLHVTALDSTEKRLRFLGRHALPNLELLCARSEDVVKPDAF
ncbi:RsmG family class I SAM-dependent methyltransferase, partial [Acinetobacter baumannii]